MGTAPTPGPYPITAAASRGSGRVSWPLRRPVEQLRARRRSIRARRLAPRLRSGRCAARVSTSAPSASVPREASSKCSRKCAGVKCESAPRRTRIRVTRSAPSARARDSIVRIRSSISAFSCTRPPPPARPPRPARRRPRPRGSARRRPRSSLPRCRRRPSVGGSRPSARASSTASASPTWWVDARKSSAGSSRSLASSRWIVPAGPGRDGVDEPERVGALPGIDQRGRLALPLGELDAGRQRPLQAAGHLEPDGVVAAPADSRRRRLSAPFDLAASGSGSRTRCRGRSCGSSARRGARARRRGRRASARRRRAGLPRSSAGSATSAARSSRRGSCRRRRASSGGRGCRAAPRCSRSRRRPRLDLDGRRVRLLVLRDQPQRLVGGVDELDAADDDAAERVALGRLEPGLVRGLARERREPVGGEREAGERAAQVRAALAQLRVERVRPRRRAPRRSARRTRARRCRGRGSRRSGRGRSGTRRARRARRARSPARSRGSRSPTVILHRLERDLARALELLDERRELPLARRAVPAADADVDRMHLASADDRHHLVARLLQLRAPARRGRGCRARARSRSRSRGSPARGA